MARNTTRDKLWSIALTEVVKRGRSITASELAASIGSSERSARDCLKFMASEGFITERRDGGVVEYVESDEFRLLQRESLVEN